MPPFHDILQVKPNNRANMNHVPPVSSLMSPPEAKPLETFDHKLSLSATPQDLCSNQDTELPPIAARKRTQSEVNLPSPPVTPYTGNKRRKSHTSEQIDNDVVGPTADPVLFPRHDSVADVATDEPLFAPMLHSTAEALIERHITTHMARFDNKLNKPTRDEYHLALSCVPIVSTQYKQDPIAWAKKEREILERQVLLMNRRRPETMEVKLQRIAPAPTKKAVISQPRLRRISRAKRTPRSTPKHKALDSFDSPSSSYTKLPRTIGTNRDDTDYSSLEDLSPPISTLGGSAKALKADWKGQMLDLSNDPDRHLLSSPELNLAATLRLSCATYLCSKRRIFQARVNALNVGKEFRKTDAQQACKIDVNKASKLWTAYDRVGWFKAEHFRQHGK